MQILFETSEESKKTLKGLSILKGYTEQLRNTNIGWKSLISKKNTFKKFNKEYFYFNHSYYQICKNENILSYIRVEKKVIPAIIRKGNIIGFQFHPENSQANGIKLIDLILKQLTIL